MFQFFHLVPSLTAVENIAVPMEIAGRRDAMARARQLIAEVGLADRAHHYPSQLSGGEQQRIAIARALANDPPIVLADEPTGNLDSGTGRIILDLLLNVRRTRKATLVLVTHDADLAALADTRLTLRDGRQVDVRGEDVPFAMTFILLMALREIRASWRRLLFFFVCIAIGVGSIVALRSVIQNVRAALARETRALIASDILLSSNPPLAPDVRELVAREQRAGRVAGDDRRRRDRDDGRGRPTAGQTARMVELRAVQAGVSVLRHADAARGRVLARRSEGPRSAGPARAAGAARPARRRSHPHRDAALRDSRRDRRRARPQPGRVQPRPARAGRLRRPPATGLLSFGSRANYQLLLRAPEATVRELGDDAHRGVREPVRARRAATGRTPTASART